MIWECFLRAYIVVDLGFGDSGKGLVTDFLVREFAAGLVVRYNGGAQAGHNVVTPDGRHHTFSQFGSGTFIPGVRTYLSRDVVIHPTALLVEGDVLEGKGVQDVFSRLQVSDKALVITPFHQATNRIRELARGADRHGSCGVGVGEAVEDALLHAGLRVLAGDLHRTEVLRRKLQSIRDQKREQVTAICKEASQLIPSQELEIFEREDVIDTWISSLSRIEKLGLVVSDALLERWLQETQTVVFEGAQGVLLDGDAGFHPYTTWSNCTAANAIELLREVAPDADVHQLGVMRSYAMRHGPGPLPTETKALTSVIAEHNQHNEWQGPPRYGWFDAVLARYALSVSHGINTLVVTHLDILSQLDEWRYCLGYQDWPGKTGIVSERKQDKTTSFRLPDLLSLEERLEITEALFHVTPVLDTCEADSATVIRKIESLLGKPVGLISHGPRASDIKRLDPL